MSNFRDLVDDIAAKIQYSKNNDCDFDTTPFTPMFLNKLVTHIEANFKRSEILSQVELRKSFQESLGNDEIVEKLGTLQTALKAGGKAEDSESIVKNWNEVCIIFGEAESDRMNTMKSIIALGSFIVNNDCNPGILKTLGVSDDFVDHIYDRIIKLYEGEGEERFKKIDDLCSSFSFIECMTSKPLRLFLADKTVILDHPPLTPENGAILGTAGKAATTTEESTTWALNSVYKNFIFKAINREIRSPGTTTVVWTGKTWIKMINYMLHYIIKHSQLSRRTDGDGDGLADPDQELLNWESAKRSIALATQTHYGLSSDNNGLERITKMSETPDWSISVDEIKKSIREMLNPAPDTETANESLNINEAFHSIDFDEHPNYLEMDCDEFYEYVCDILDCGIKREDGTNCKDINVKSCDDYEMDENIIYSEINELYSIISSKLNSKIVENTLRTAALELVNEVNLGLVTSLPGRQLAMTQTIGGAGAGQSRKSRRSQKKSKINDLGWGEGVACTFRSGVGTNNKIIRSWGWICKFMPAGAYVSSGYRSASEQQDLILTQAIKDGLDHPQGSGDPVTMAKKATYTKSDFNRIAERVTKLGYTIAYPSRHMDGNAFDVSGADTADIKRIIDALSNESLIKFKASKVLEEKGKNNAVHVVIQSVEKVDQDAIEKVRNPNPLS